MIFDPNTDLAFFVLRLATVVYLLSEGPLALKTSSKLSLPYLLGIVMICIAASFALGVFVHIAAGLLILLTLYRIYEKTVKQSRPFTGTSGWQLDFIILAISVGLFFAHPTSYSIVS